MATNVKVVINTTEKFKEVQSRCNSMWENTDTEAEAVCDCIEAFKSRQFGMLHGWDSVDLLLDCIEDNDIVNIEGFPNEWYAVYIDLNNKAKKELEAERVGA
jgi:hypothetical protein